MRLTEHVYLVGGGSLGFGLSDDYDCHIYLIDGGGDLALIDAGAGRDMDIIVECIRFDGLDPQNLRYLFLTHAHADHAGGAALWRERFGVDVLASAAAGEYLAAGDEQRISLDVAKRAGFYPPDYHLRACEVARALTEGDCLAVGGLSLCVLETPGHCSGMLSFLTEDAGRRILFSGDTVFHGGRIMISNLWDCDVRQYVASIRKLADVEVDALLPGHLTIALTGGVNHIRRAADMLDRMTIPSNII